jgi:ribosomal protein L7Ae-like RNA K-turn-binding protein
LVNDIDVKANHSEVTLSNKDKVKVDENLPHLVEDLLRQTSLQALAMAKKAGLVATGQAKAEAMIRDGVALALIQASDAGTDGVKKLAAALKAQKVYEEREVVLIDEFTSEELDKTLNGTNTMYVALSNGGAAEKLVKMISRLMNFKAMEA